LFVIGQLLHGIGGSTLITVGYSFVDDSVPASASPMYICKYGESVFKTNVIIITINNCFEMIFSAKCGVPKMVKST